MSDAFWTALGGWIFWLPVVIICWDPDNISLSVVVFLVGILASVIAYWNIVLGLV